MRRVVAVGSCLFALATASCAAIFGFERLSEGPLDDAAAGLPDGTSSVEAGADLRCSVPGWPGAPNVPAGGSLTVIGALSLLDFGVPIDGGSSTPPGYNLDTTCSPTLATGTCTSTELASTYAANGADRSGTGVDNAAFSLIAFLSQLPGTTISAQAINDGVRTGRYGAVVRVTGWNGQADDGEIGVEVFPAIGFASDAGPAFVETDTWRIDKRFEIASGIESSSQQSVGAYVSGGQLVARFKELTLEIFISDDPKPFDVVLEDAVMTGALSVDADAGFLSRGTVAGRWKSSAFLGQVREIYIKNGNDIIRSTICDGNPIALALYAMLKSHTCDGRDIRSDSQDNRALPCDAISAAARIDGYRTATIGTWVDSPAIATRCLDAAIEAGDDCPSN